MCGFVGYLSFSEKPEKRLITKMASKIHSRGPDSDGSWIDEVSGIALSHKRLSIIDLTKAGHQPKLSKNKRFVIAFNGEIYNHQSIRKLLQKETKISWEGNSDTETLIEAISFWGIEKTLKQINGMFAFAVWDKQEKILFLARDRMGEKPLYYGLIGDTLLFGSQLKSFAEFPGWENKIDKFSTKLFFKYGYIPSPHCIFKDFFKLEPAHFLTVSLDNLKSPKKHNYWNLKSKIANAKSLGVKNEEEYLQTLEKKLLFCVKERMNADVPLGAFLSGGLDSSTIVAMMNCNSNKPIKTFTIGFCNKDYDETNKARKISQYFGTEHIDYQLKDSDISDIFDKLGYVWDEPFSDISQVPSLILSRITRNEVKVALSGDGGDELFCGYNRYLKGLDLYKNSSFQFIDFLNKKIDLRKLFLRFSRESKYEKIDKFFNSLGSKDIVDYYINVVKIFDENDPLLAERIDINSDFSFEEFSEYKLKDEEKLMYFDFMQYLPDDLMTKIDRASMEYGLETRSPFLDHELIEYSFSIPLELKKKRGKGKYILKKILSKYLPQEFVETGKQGFSVPILQWMQGPMRTLAVSLINEEINNPDSIFNPARLKILFNEKNYEFRKNQKIWTILIFLLWKRSLLI